MAAKNTGRRKKVSHDAILTLEDIGVKPDQSSRAQRIAAIEGAKIQEYVEKQQEAEEEISKAGLLKFATGAHVGHNSGENEWYTHQKDQSLTVWTPGSPNL